MEILMHDMSLPLSLRLSLFNSCLSLISPVYNNLLFSASKQIKFTTANENKPKSSFVKKSALLTSGKDFRFNFALPNNNDENEAAATQDVPQTAAAATRISSSLQLSSGKEEPFRFNFQIENGPEDINFDGLMLNS